MDTKALVKKINNLLSYKNIFNELLDISKEIGSIVNLYSNDDVSTIISYLKDNDMCILNNKDITQKFINYLSCDNESIEEKLNIISLSVKKLYKQDNVNLSYRQHCNEIFTLLLNTITDNTFHDDYLYELLYEKLLINQLNSEDTIIDILNNDLTRYIPNDKIIIIKPLIHKLLCVDEINNLKDMTTLINNIKEMLNIDVEPPLGDEIKNKEIIMSIKKKINLNDSEFAENEKEVIDEEIELEGEELESEKLEQESLSKKKVRNMSKKISKRSPKNLNSIILEEGEEDNVDEITVVEAKNPEEMDREDLEGDVKEIAIELSRQRKILLSLASKMEKAINLSKRETNLNRMYIHLSESAEELVEIAEEIEKEKEETPMNYSDMEYSTYEEEGMEDINNSKKLKRNISHRSERVELSRSKKPSSRSAIDIIFKK